MAPRPSSACAYGKALVNYYRKPWPIGVVVTISLPVRAVWGSIPAPVRSNTESSTPRHRCDIFSEFEVLSPRR